MIKAILTTVVSLLLLASLTGCVGLVQNLLETDSTQSSDANNQSQNNQDQTESNNTNANSANTRQVGQDQYGYISIPEHWVVFQDLDPMPGVIQFTDGAGTIISINIFDNTVDPKTAISNLIAHLTDVGYEDMTGATVSLNGETAYQAYGFNSGSHKYMVIWMFNGSDGNVHYIAAEGPNSGIMTAVDAIEESYSYHP